MDLTQYTSIPGVQVLLIAQSPEYCGRKLHECISQLLAKLCFPTQSFLKRCLHKKRSPVIVDPQKDEKISVEAVANFLGRLEIYLRGDGNNNKAFTTMLKTVGLLNNTSLISEERELYEGATVALYFVLAYRGVFTDIAFVQSYDKLGERYMEHTCFTDPTMNDLEKLKVALWANFMKVMLLFFPHKAKKMNQCIDVLTGLCEGKNVIYTYGGDKNLFRIRREEIYHIESGTKAEPQRPRQKPGELNEIQDEDETDFKKNFSAIMNNNSSSGTEGFTEQELDEQAVPLLLLSLRGSANSYAPNHNNNDNDSYNDYNNINHDNDNIGSVRIKTEVKSEYTMCDTQSQPLSHAQSCDLPMMYMPLPLPISLSTSSSSSSLSPSYAMATALPFPVTQWTYKDAVLSSNSSNVNSSYSAAMPMPSMPYYPPAMPLSSSSWPGQVGGLLTMTQPYLLPPSATSSFSSSSDTYSSLSSSSLKRRLDSEGIAAGWPVFSQKIKTEPGQSSGSTGTESTCSALASPQPADEEAGSLYRSDSNTSDISSLSSGGVSSSSRSCSESSISSSTSSSSSSAASCGSGDVTQKHMMMTNNRAMYAPYQQHQQQMMTMMPQIGVSNCYALPGAPYAGYQSPYNSPPYGPGYGNGPMGYDSFGIGPSNMSMPMPMPMPMHAGFYQSQMPSLHSNINNGNYFNYYRRPDSEVNSAAAMYSDQCGYGAYGSNDGYSTALIGAQIYKT